MMLAWVVSLLLLFSSLMANIERLGALRIIEINAVAESQKKFISAEKAVQECEQNIAVLTQIQSNLCFIKPAGKHRWLISSIEKPGIQVGVAFDEKTGMVTRVNWRQVFE